IPNATVCTAREFRDLLVPCGTGRYLAKEPVEPSLSEPDKVPIRRVAGLKSMGLKRKLKDHPLRGLSHLLAVLSGAAPYKVRGR
ncbi:MAG: hypothetical protein GDA36_14205, partial [Rhodobacteraceae bacterium]|nr:hypothetical protein [Paracoccaceae bacterium]